MRLPTRPVLTVLSIFNAVTPHSHGASASTPLIYFEWSDVKRCRTELWVRRVASLHWRCSRQKLKTFQLFKRQRRRQPIRSPYANTLAQTLANPVHATPEKYVIVCCHYDGRVSTKLQTRPPSSVDADAPCEGGVKLKKNPPALTC